jgi:hypothetical protein
MARPIGVSDRQDGFTRVDLLVALVVLLLSGGMFAASGGLFGDAQRRMMSANNLKQLTLATINAAETNSGKLPPGLGNFYPGDRLGPNNGYGPVLFHLLPYIEQDTLYKKTLGPVGGVHLYTGWTLAGLHVKTYVAPGDPTARPGSDSTSYLANFLVFRRGGARFPASIPDGTSNTIAYAEGYAEATDSFTWDGRTDSRPVVRRWWEDPVWAPAQAGVMFQAAPARNVADAALPQGFTRAGIQVGLCDGTVKLVSPRVSPATFYGACTPAGGEVLGSDW